MWNTIHQKFNKIIDLIDSPLMLLGSYTLAQIKDILGIIGIVVTVMYTLWKWRREFKESRK
jgi:NADH:ubiquinone oxidoreductase subunit 4 (subunit M)